MSPISTAVVRLYGLADSKGHDVAMSTVKDHVQLFDPDGNLVKNKSGGAAFSYADARRYLEEQPDRKGWATDQHQRRFR